MTLDEIKDTLCQGEHSHLIISWNDDSGMNYSTVEETIASDDAEPEKSRYHNFIDDEDKQRCIDTNSLWVAHWYPNTPVGFCVLSASTFEKLKDALEEIALGEIAERA